MDGAYSTHGADEKYIQNVDRKFEGKRPLGRPRRRWKYNIRTNIRENGRKGVDWMHLAQHKGQ